jgi:hypothetical protein
MEDITAEMSEQIMQAWGAWMGKVGDALVDGGAPFAGRTAVAGDGSVTSASDLNGYTIVDAPDIDTAKTLCDGNPFVSDGTAKFAIEIYELAPM